MIHTFYIGFFLTFCTLLWSGEVDHYLSWGHPLSDSAPVLNQKMNRMLKDGIESLPSDCSCEYAASTLLSQFGVKLNSDLEQWIKGSNSLDLYKPNLDEALENSIFRIASNSSTLDPFEKTSLAIQLDEIINIDGIYFGIDKLSHFTGSGYLYYQSYLVFKDHPDVHAEEMAIWFGILGEKSIIGRIASGVFSYADLEANYQGLLFGRRMCEGKDPLLTKSARGWELIRPFDIRNYVNPLWDESYNPSFYYDGFNLTLMPKNTPVLQHLPEYCQTYTSPFVQDLFHYYDSYSFESFSHSFLKSLIQDERIPDPSPFNIRKLCKD